MFREFNKETAGLLKKTLELSGTKNLSVFPMKKGGGYLLSMNGNEFLLYREDKRMFLSAPNFQKDFRNAISFIVKKKPCDYYFFKGSHCWTWKASKFINSSRGENLARVFRLAGVRKKFSIKIGRTENLFSGKI
jgi:hypothetical protein